MARFERVNLTPEEWSKTHASFPDAIVYQTPAWLAFLAETQRGRPILAALKEGDQTLGYFSGLVVRQFGLKILGSPFRGWTCPYMGFNLLPSVPRTTAIKALRGFAFRDLGCVHFEVVDPFTRLEDVAGLGLHHEMHATYEVDLTQSEDVIFEKMNHYRRRDIRRAEKNGLSIEEAHDHEFADEYAEQLKDVFAKQNLVPTFGVERVRALIKHMKPTGMLLMLRARDCERRCVATALFLGMNQTAFYWGGASWRQYQSLHPNELLQWYSMRYWKGRGAKSYNLVGTMDFKARFGGQQTAVAMISQSRNWLVSRLRASAPTALRAALRLAWKAKVLRPRAVGTPQH